MYIGMYGYLYLYWADLRMYSARSLNGVGGAFGAVRVREDACVLEWLILVWHC